MKVQPFTRVIMTRDIHDEGLCSGDVGTVVEIYNDSAGNVIGYELEMFAASGETLAVVSVPASAVRQATSADRLAARVG